MFIIKLIDHRTDRTSGEVSLISVRVPSILMPASTADETPKSRGHLADGCHDFIMVLSSSLLQVRNIAIVRVIQEAQKGTV